MEQQTICTFGDQVQFLFLFLFRSLHLKFLKMQCNPTNKKTVALCHPPILTKIGICKKIAQKKCFVFLLEGQTFSQFLQTRVLKPVLYSQSVGRPLSFTTSGRPHVFVSITPGFSVLFDYTSNPTLILRGKKSQENQP